MVSCIIPAYRARDTLGRCLDSLLASVYSDFEALVVLNGEDDGTSAVLGEYAARDARIKPLSSNKRGVSAARNIGLDNASGAFICFLDADDAIHPLWMGTLVRALDDADLASCTYRDVVLDDRGRLSSTKHYYFMREGVLSRKEYLLEINGPYANNWGLLPSPCIKMFRTDLIRTQGIRFNESMHYAEDFDFMLQYLRHCSHVCVRNKQLYDYYRRADSAVSLYHGNILEIYEKNISDILGLMNGVFSEDERAPVYHMLASMTIGGMVRLCRRDADIDDNEIMLRLAAFITLPFLPDLYACYKPGPGQSADIPALALSGNIKVLFDACRARSGDKFK